MSATRTQADAHGVLGHRHLSSSNVRAEHMQTRLLLPLDCARLDLKLDGFITPQELALEIRRQLYRVMCRLRRRR